MTANDPRCRPHRFICGGRIFIGLNISTYVPWYKGEAEAWIWIWKKTLIPLARGLVALVVFWGLSWRFCWILVNFLDIVHRHRRYVPSAPPMPPSMRSLPAIAARQLSPSHTMLHLYVPAIIVSAGCTTHHSIRTFSSVLRVRHHTHTCMPSTITWTTCPHGHSIHSNGHAFHRPSAWGLLMHRTIDHRYDFSFFIYLPSNNLRLVILPPFNHQGLVLWGSDHPPEYIFFILTKQF